VDGISLYTSLQSDRVLALINGHILCQLSVNLTHHQLDITLCCDLGEDMGFMEAILGIQHSSRFYNLIYRHPLLLAVTTDYSTLGILVTHTMVLVTHTMVLVTHTMVLVTHTMVLVIHTMVLVTHTMVLVTHIMGHVCITLRDIWTDNHVYSLTDQLYTISLILVDVLEQSVQRH